MKANFKRLALLILLITAGFFIKAAFRSDSNADSVKEVTVKESDDKPYQSWQPMEPPERYKEVCKRRKIVWNYKVQEAYLGTRYQLKEIMGTDSNGKEYIKTIYIQEDPRDPWDPDPDEGKFKRISLDYFVKRLRARDSLKLDSAVNVLNGRK